MKSARRRVKALGAMPGADTALIALCVERKRLWDAEKAHWETNPSDNEGAYRICSQRCDAEDKITRTRAESVAGVVAKLEDIIAWRDQPEEEDEHDMQALRSALADLKRIVGGAA